MSSFATTGTGVGFDKGIKRIRCDTGDDSDSSLSSASSAGTSNELQNENDSETSETDPFDNEPMTSDSSSDEDTNVHNGVPKVAYERNVSLTNASNNHGVPYSAPLQVNATSSTTPNVSAMKSAANQFQPPAIPESVAPNAILPLRTAMKRELLDGSLLFPSTPKIVRLEADQLTSRTNGELSSTTKDLIASLVSQTSVTHLIPYSSPTVSSAIRNSATPTSSTFMVQPSQCVSVQSSSVPSAAPTCYNSVIPVKNEVKPSDADTSRVYEFTETTTLFTQKILRKIFRMCPLNDRKNIRLVCQDWFDVCSAFEAEEKLCVSRFHNENLSEVITTLYRSKRRCLNFEFHGLDFGRKPRVTFWKICGPRVASMKLFDCKISTPAFLNILRHCYNLKALEFHFIRLRDLRNGVRLYSTYTHPIPADLANRSLRTLRIHFEIHVPDDPTWYWLDLIRQFFRFFPNVAEFSFGQRSWNVRSRLTTSASCDSSVDRFSLDRYFVRSRMESIALNVLYHQGFGWKSLSNVKGLTSITEIALDFDHDVDFKSFSAFVLQQINLKVVTLYSFVEEIPAEKLARFMPLFLKRLSLRVFNVSVHKVAIQWNYDWSILLSSSNVEALRIACLAIDFSSCLPAGCSFPASSKLVTLAIQIENPWNLEFVPVLDSFHKLEELHLSYITDEIMGSLCRRQNQIKSLTANRTTSKVVCRLNNLEKLEIPESVTLEGFFYNLKHLRILRPAVLLPENKNFIARNYIDLENLRYLCFCSSLEILWVDCFLSKLYCCNSIQFLAIIDGLLNRMKGLKFLYLAHNIFMANAYQPELTEEEISFIFYRCSSLRVFIYGDTFVKDVVEEGRIRKLERGRCSPEELLRKYVKADADWEYQYLGLLFNNDTRNTTNL